MNGGFLFVEFLSPFQPRLIAVALVNDHHFWALKPGELENENEDEQAGLAQYPTGTSIDPWLEHTVSQEMQLIQCLSSWKPFDLPTEDLVDVFTGLCDAGAAASSEAARARQMAIAELSKQDEAYLVPWFTLTLCFLFCF